MDSMFNTVLAAELNAERDVYVGLPIESANRNNSANRPGFHRVPIRSACTESANGDRRTRVQMVPGSPNVVQTCQGLRRLLLKFPNAFVPGIKVFEANSEGDRANLSMGFALYDHRVGPTAEEDRVLQNIDGLATFLRNTIIRCERIRKTLKLGPEGMNAQQQQVAADMMDLHVARPATTGGTIERRAPMDDSQRPAMPSRYCYVKLVAPDPNVNEKYHTYFWTMDGKRIPFDTVVGFRNYHVVPFVELEDIFVSKAVRSVQLKLRECLVIPPAERIQQRMSVAFEGKVCRREDEDEDLLAAAAAEAPPTEPELKCPREPSVESDVPSAKRSRREPSEESVATPTPTQQPNVDDEEQLP